MVKALHILTLASLLLTSVACSDSTEFWEGPDSSNELVDGKVEVLFPVSTSISMATRTQIDPDDLSSVRWSVGDQVSLWAEGLNNSDSDLTSEMFELKAFSSTYQVARFSGAITPMATDQEYYYSAFYPYTSSVSGKVVNVELPSAQSGDYDGVYDFRVADSTKGDALLSESENDGFNLTFRSVMHVLQITIPEGYNSLGVPVKTMTITMPTDVVGSLSLDISDPTATPQIVSGGSNVITVDLSDNPITDGDGRCVWLFIKPTTNVTGDIKIGCIGVGDEYAYDYSIPVTDHTFAAGRITPINSEICEEMPFTTLRIKIGTNNLGEELTNINITAPEGAIFKESGTNTMVIENDGSGYYDMNYITGLYGDKFKAGSLSVEFESEHALIPMDDISLASVTEDGVNTYSRTVPYLLDEDFETMNSYVKNGFPTVGDTTTSTGEMDYVDLSDKGLTTVGWTATRSASNGSVMSICCRSETDGSLTMYEGRLNSPTIPYLKKAAKLKIDYDYDGSYYAREFKFYVVYWKWEDYKSGSTYYQRGYFTGDDPDASDDIESIVCSDGSTVYSDSESGKDMYVSNYWVNSLVYSSSQSSTYYVSNATTSTRLAWRVWGSGRPSLGNANYCLYIDNVKVQIAQ